MNTHVERMIAERKELSDRLGKLNVFLARLDDPDPPALTMKQIILMRIQSHMMAGYQAILERRIDNDT